MNTKEIKKIKKQVLNLVFNLVYASFDLWSDFILESETFEEAVEIELGRNRFYIYKKGEGFNKLTTKEQLTESFVIDKRNYLTLRTYYKDLIKNNLLTDQDIRDFLLKIIEGFETGKKFLKQHWDDLQNNTYPEDVIFVIDNSGLIHILGHAYTLLRLSTSKGLINRKLEHAIEIYKTPPKRGSLLEALRFSPKKLQEIENQVINQLKDILGINLTKSQRKAINSILQGGLFSLEAPPGGYKTGITALILILLIYLILLNRFNLNKPITIVVSAQTYNALKELLEKFIELFEILIRNNNRIKSLLQPDDIFIGLNISQVRRNEDFKSEIEKLKILEKQKLLTLSEYYSRTWYKPNILNKQNYLIGKLINIVFIPTSRFRLTLDNRGYIAQYPIMFEEPVEVLILDEASQISGITILEILAMLSLQQPPNLMLGIGDNAQLPPIYTSSLGGEIPLYVIGKFYNWFTFWEDKAEKLNLEETGRLSSEIVDVVKPLYENFDRKIISIKPPNKEPQIELKKDGYLFKILNTNILNKYPLIRIEIEGIEKDKNQSEIEAILVKEILSQVKLTREKVAIITPFKDQEILLKKKINELRDDISELCTIGTVDKMQGKDVDFEIISFTAHNFFYIKQIIEFIFAPNRLNVAFTRTKGPLIAIHSKAIREAAYSSISTQSISKAREFLLGFIKHGYKNFEDEESILNSIPILQTDMGIKLFRRLVEKTPNKIEITNYLPFLTTYKEFGNIKVNLFFYKR